MDTVGLRKARSYSMLLLQKCRLSRFLISTLLTVQFQPIPVSQCQQAEGINDLSCQTAFATERLSRRVSSICDWSEQILGMIP